MLKKMFKKNLLSNKIKNFNYNQTDLITLKDEVSKWNNMAMKIQSKFNFVLPNYIIDEILKNDEKKDYHNLHYLVNCAVVNGRISKNDGKIIKDIYC